MTNTLITVKDQNSTAALVEKYIVETLLEQESFDGVLNNSEYIETLTIPHKTAVYAEASRVNTFRTPQNVPNSNLASDPACGVTIAMSKAKAPIEFFHDFVGNSTLTEDLTLRNLDQIAKDGMAVAATRRMNQLMQNCLKVGRMKPFKYLSNGSTDIPIDSSVEATSVTIHELTFTFEKASPYFANGKTAFNQLNAQDRHKMSDYLKGSTELSNAHAMKIKGRWHAYISEAIKMDLMEDNKYFAAAVNAFNGRGLAEGSIMDWAGIAWHIDDDPFTENLTQPNVRANFGVCHTAFMLAKQAVAYLKLGSKSPNKGKMKAIPNVKVQDITKTGTEVTIGYSMPFAALVLNSKWCRSISGPVSCWQQNGTLA